MGGENVFQVIRILKRSGSSPRGRGKRERDPARRRAMGLIPAWAGKTKGGTTLHQGSWAHPRVGGENSPVVVSDTTHTGSSPRGRGKLLLNRLSVKLSGLIPAWAGKTPRRSSSTFSSWAHPRVGGENGLDARRWPWDQGSSPRGRGKPAWLLRSLRAWRLIPAWAGKTTATPLPGFGARAHPRVGGEN